MFICKCATYNLNLVNNHQTNGRSDSSVLSQMFNNINYIKDGFPRHIAKFIAFGALLKTFKGLINIL